MCGLVRGVVTKQRVLWSRIESKPRAVCQALEIPAAQRILNQLVTAEIMKLVAGALLLLGAEQAYAHANLIQFPNYEPAASILFPAAVVFLVLGVLLLGWGLVTETRRVSESDRQHLEGWTGGRTAENS